MHIRPPFRWRGRQLLVPIRAVEGRAVCFDLWRLRQRRPFRRPVGQGQGRARSYDVSTANVEFARSLGADVIIDYKAQRFEIHASDVAIVFDLIDGETRERSRPLLKQGGALVTTLTDPSQEKAREHGVQAMR
jgi:hypothetical protein